ncbi:MAG TPA: LytTR family DNA-binding domain-containing protein [Caulobacter sp.]|nr:LytTR family DNA-binding domain-containing protein [Caulobacter sp.]
MAAFAGSRHLRGAGLALLAGFFLAFTGAFGTDESPLGVRLAYWLGLILAGSAVGVAIGAFLDRVGWLEERPWLQGAAIVLVMTPPLVLLVWLVTGLAFAGWRLDPGRIPDLLLPVLVVTVAVTALNYIVERRPQETHAQPAGSAPARFLDRLPPKLRGAELYAVEAEDHYLRLHTSRGQDLILMRLSDAVAELEGIEGARTHRSWWVAKAAVEGARRGDGRATLTLKGGAQAPVSRAYARALRAAGWY